MKSHLQSFQLKIRLLGPVFIGSGTEINKKEYLYIQQTKKVCIPNLAKLTAFLDKKGLLNDYLNFMLSPQADLLKWLEGCGIKPDSYSEFISYEINAGDALDENHALKGIQLFIKDPYGLPYIPGSSLKGALRTALLCRLLREKKQYSDQKITELNNAPLDRWDKKLFEKDTGKIESDLLHSLNLNESKSYDAVNSIMRGIQISDSSPIDTGSLVLCRKQDKKLKGDSLQKAQNNNQGLNLCRECLKPDTTVSFTVTLDNTVLKSHGIDIEYIKKAIEVCFEVQEEQYAKFADYKRLEGKSLSKTILYLGGGAGFLSKTYTYSMDKEKALKLTAKLLHLQFDVPLLRRNQKTHNHDRDVQLGVSPHTLKCTSCNGSLYQFGKCEVIF